MTKRSDPQKNLGSRAGQPSIRPIFRPSPLWLIPILLLAFALRVHDLGHSPLGAHYDEAANAILADEIAQGARPLFIRAYTGKEVGYFYLAAAMVRLVGQPLIGIRLTSAFIGVLAIALSYRLVRELFGEKTWSAPVALLAAALQAGNLWAIAVSRLGFRAVLQPALQAVTLIYLYRGFRERGRRPWLNWVWAGVWCGLSAYSYLAIRAFPILLGLFSLWVVVFWPAPSGPPSVPPGPAGGRKRGASARASSPFARPGGRKRGASARERASFPSAGPGGRKRSASARERASFPFTRPGGRKRGAPARASSPSPAGLAGEGRGGGAWALRGRLVRLGQIVLFGLVAALVFSPLGLFYLRNPQYFATRMGQVSVFGEPGGGNRWGPFWYATRVSFGMFVWRGDLNWRFNVPGAPALWWPVGLFFLVGLGIGVWRLGAGLTGAARTRLGNRGYEGATYWLLLLWLPVMLLPSILGGQDVELSLSLRAIGVQPALYIWAALGLAACARAAGRLLERWNLGGWRRWAIPVALALLLAATTGWTAYQAFGVWGPSTPGYYVASGDLVDAAAYVNDQIPPDARVYVSSEHYRHPTMALLTERYADLSWLIGEQTIVVPPPESEVETWMLYTHAAMPAGAWLEGTLGPEGAGSPAPPVPLAPDGKPAFRVYRFSPGQAPVPEPEHPARANLGHTLTYLGHDQHGPARSGETLDVTLYWRVERRVEDRDDWTFFAHLVDERGFRWGGETFFHYPASQWQPGEVILYRKQFPIDPGAPPGAYRLTLGVFSPSLDARLPALDEAGQLAGTTARAGPFEVERAPAPPEALPAMQETLNVQFGEVLALAGSDRDRSDLRPGETLALTLHWLADGPVEPGTTVQLGLEGAAGSVPLWQGDPVQGDYAFADWQPPEYVRDRYALRLPRDLAAGDYALHLSLLGSDGTPIDARWNGSSSALVKLGLLHIHASDRLWEPPPYEHEVGARLGDAVELVGYTVEQPAAPARPGDTLRLTLIWRCLAEIETPYTVFTHLLDGAQQVRGQKDNPPQGGRYPTTLWAPGEIVVDAYEIVVDEDAPPGRYVIEVGMYDPKTMARLPARSPTGADADRVLLAQIEMGN